jgi:hypothetical protein
MTQRSVQNSKDEKSTRAPRQTTEHPSSSSTPRPSTRSFPFVLEIILLTEKAAETKLIDIDSKRAIRLTCKAAKSVVDAHCQKVTHDLLSTKGSLSDLSPWPWPNISELDLTFKDRRHSLKAEDIQNLVKLSLPQLRTLHFGCHDLLPLAESNWPMLKNLYLGVKNEGEKAAAYQDFQFPEWPLKHLSISFSNWRNVDFLPALLRNCAELTYFDLRGMYNSGLAPNFAEEVATMITSTPFTQLEEMKLTLITMPDGFHPKIFEREWPSLKKLTWCDGGVLPLIVSKRWFNNVEYLELDDYTADLTGDHLHSALKSLEKSNNIKILVLDCVSYSVIAKGFRGIKLESLEKLHLTNLHDEDMEFNITDSLNVLFDSCETAAFPALVELRISHSIQEEEDEDEWRLPEWNRSPTKRLIEQCPSLKKIWFEGLDVSQEVMDYLGNFRKAAGGRIEFGRIELPAHSISPDRRVFLRKLDIKSAVWESFCHQEGCDDDYLDCFYWNILPEERFRRIAYAAALKSATDVPRLKKFLDLVQSDVESSGMSVSGFQSLKSFLEQAVEGDKVGAKIQSWKWDDVGTFIDFKPKADG